jgi:hypothetical protein
VLPVRKLGKGIGRSESEGEQGRIGGDSFGHPSRYFGDLGAETEWVDCERRGMSDVLLNELMSCLHVRRI